MEIIYIFLFAFMLLFLWIFKKRTKELRKFYNIGGILLSLMLGIVGGILWILFYEKFRLAAFNVVMTILYFIFACLIRTKMGKIELDEFAVDISNKVSHDLLISFGVFICVLVTYSLTKPIILNPHGVGSFAFFILFGYNCLFYFYYRKYVGGDNE